MIKSSPLSLKRQQRRISWPLAALSLLLTGLGVVMVYNASSVEAWREFGDKFHYVRSQLIWAAIGWGAALVVSRVDWRWLEKLALPVFVFNLCLLAAVLVPGLSRQALGARRWLSVGSFSFQPSELVKLTFALYLAAWLSRERRRLVHFMAILGLVIGLVILEPDMGTALVIAFTALVVYFVAEQPLWHLVFLGISGVVAFSILALTSPYRRQRLLTFLNPTADPTGSSYHIRQVLLALGSGGLWGVGLGQSRQKYAYLPEVTTDSIFAVFAEEVGFVGSLMLVLLFLLLVYQMIKIARLAPDKFSRLLAMGITAMIGGQIVLNLGAMVALIPLTGLPLPFFSYGGSSLVVTLTGIGILLNISRATVVKR